eukprot:7580041-Pyramimonas_sp.AAC.1
MDAAENLYCRRLGGEAAAMSKGGQAGAGSERGAHDIVANGVMMGECGNTTAVEGGAGGEQAAAGAEHINGAKDGGRRGDGDRPFPVCPSRVGVPAVGEAVEGSVALCEPDAAEDGEQGAIHGDGATGVGEAALKVPAEHEAGPDKVIGAQDAEVEAIPDTDNVDLGESDRRSCPEPARDPYSQFKPVETSGSQYTRGTWAGGLEEHPPTGFCVLTPARD